MFVSGCVRIQIGVFYVFIFGNLLRVFSLTFLASPCYFAVEISFNHFAIILALEVGKCMQLF